MDRREEVREDHERLWIAIEEIKSRMLTVEAKASSIEDLMSSQRKFCQLELSRWDTITNHLREHETKIMDRMGGMEKMLENLSYRLNFIESTPIKIVLFVGGVISIGAAAWVILKHWLRAEIHP